MKTWKLATVTGTFCLATLAAIVSPSVTAENAGWYIGGNIGQAEADLDNERTANEFGFATTSIDEDDSDTGYKLFTGYQFNRGFALEAGFFDLGEYDFTADTAGGTLSGTTELRGVNLDAVGILPITDRFSAFARIGAIYAEAKSSYSGTGLVTAPDRRKERAANPKVGLGLQYDLTPSWGMRAEIERYRIDDAVGDSADIDLLSLGLVYRFGQREPVIVAAPTPVAPPPAPRPVFVAPPPPPPPTKVAFSADALFDFDSSVLKPAGKQAIDAFAADLRGTDYEVIRVTGHTDRLGSQAYNLALSERRAEAVKNYLVESAGVPSGKIETRGINGAEPVTKPEECPGERRTRELIDCLQPDRRVEVEVTGTSLR